jgi:4-carboxymuconolactone decarboxylase
VKRTLYFAATVGAVGLAIAAFALGQSSQAAKSTASAPYSTPTGNLVARDIPAAAEQVERGRRIAEELGVGSAVSRQPEMDGAGFVEYSSQYLFPAVYGRGGLTLKEREIAVMAAIITQGVPGGLHLHFREIALRAGLSEREMQEVIFTACFYAGWPKCSGAMSQFRAAMNGPNQYPKEKRGLAPVPGQEPAVVNASNDQGARPTAPYSTPTGKLVARDIPAAAEQVERGRRIGEELGIWSAVSRQPEMDGAGFIEYGNQYLLPAVYGRGGLTLKEREIAVMSAIITQGVPGSLHLHFREIALRAGLSEREMQEVIFTTCFYAGWPKCSGAMSQFRTVMNGPNEHPKQKRGLAPAPGK